MFKMQIQWNRQGEWIDCVFPPCEYATALFRVREYQERNMDHLYRIIPTGGYYVTHDTPLAEAYGG